MALVHVQRAQRLIAGPDALAALHGELTALGVQRALVLCGPHVAASGCVDRVLAAAGGRYAAVFTDCAGNAPLPVVDAAVQRARAFGADGLVSVGGSSTHDTAKGAAVLIGHGGRLRDCASAFEPPDRLVLPALSGPRLPIVAVGTTLSGAEGTTSAGFEDAAAREKLVVVDPSVAPKVVLLDPELAASTPPRVLAGSACNTLDHCVEAVCSRAHGPITDTLALAALSRLHRGVERAVAGDRAALADCLIAAYMSTLAMPVGGLGVNHAVCHVLGVYGATHADAHAAMLVAGMRFNLPASDKRQVLLGAALDGGAAHPPGAAADLLEALVARLDVPVRLREIGLPATELPAVAARALHDRHLYANPRPVTSATDIEGLLEAAW